MEKILAFIIMLSCVLSESTPLVRLSRKNQIQNQEKFRTLVYSTRVFRGSGTLLSGGYVLTNFHVVHKYDDTENYIVFSNGDTTSFVVIYKDIKNDLALLKSTSYPKSLSLEPELVFSLNGIPKKRDVFSGIGYPQGEMGIITSEFALLKDIRTFWASSERNQKSVLISGAYLLLKPDTSDYHGASGTLMMSQNSCGIVSGMSDNFLVLISNSTIHEFLKKSGYF